MEDNRLKMAKYTEISEKERLLREILHSARLIAGKREFCRETLSSQIVEKGGLKRDKREEKEEIVTN